MQHDIDHRELRAELQRAAKKGDNDRAVFKVGQRVMLQSQVGPKVWDHRALSKNVGNQTTGPPKITKFQY